MILIRLELARHIFSSVWLPLRKETSDNYAAKWPQETTSRHDLRWTDGKALIRIHRETYCKALI